MRVETCKSCPARIIWCTSAATGRFMPVDADPSEDGNVELVDHPDPTATVPRAIVHAQPPLVGGPFRLSHFVTCPNADQHRKSR